MSQATWDSMGAEDKMKYSDAPMDDPKEIAGFAVEQVIDMGNQIIIDPEKDAMAKELAELKALLAASKCDADKCKCDPIIVDPKEETENPEIDPYDLDLDGLKAWLTIQEIPFSARISKLESLQKLIP